MGKVTDTIFKPVKFEFGQVHIAGGHTAIPMSAKSKSVEGSDKKQHIFVKMATSEKWLLHTICGNGDKSRYSFSRTSLLNALRDQILRLAYGTAALDATPVVAPE